MLVFFDDELTTFRNKNDRFICNVKKVKKRFMECERDIGSLKNGAICLIYGAISLIHGAISLIHGAISLVFRKN